MVTYLLLTLSGALLAAGVLLPAVWFFSILGFIPLAHVLTSLRRGPLATFFLGCFFGIVYCGGVIVWFWQILPLDWLHVLTPLQSILLVGTTWAIVTVVLATFFGLFFLLFVHLRRGNIGDTVLAAALFTLVQYAQLWGFAFLTYGDASLLGAHFSSAQVGYAAAWFPPLLQVAYGGGVYALTFTLVFLGFLSYHLYTHMRMGGRVALTIAVLIFLAFDGAYTDGWFAQYPTDIPSVSVALVSTDFVPVARTDDELLRRSDFQRALLREWSGTTPDLIVFPEAASFLDTTHQSPRTGIEDVIGTSTVALIDSSAVADGSGGKKVRMSFFAPGGVFAGHYDKLFLVPQGEYTPYLYRTIQALIGGNVYEKTVMEYHAVSRGASSRVVTMGDVTLGALFCFEVFSPNLYRELTIQGAEVLINAASQSLFHGSQLVDSHVLAQAKVRAVENDRYLAMARNAAPSLLLSPRGTVVAKSPDGEATILSTRVPLVETTTPYARFGDLVMIVPLLIIVAFAIRRWKYYVPTAQSS